jgi:hypothetical protein
MNTEKLRLLAKDLTKAYPRSPRETLAGYLLAARLLDKCRALLNGTQGEYIYDCPLDRWFFEFTGIDSNQLKDFVATGATDPEAAQWITQHAQPRPRVEIIKWNNHLRDLRVSELPDQTQEFFEDYIPKFVPKNRPIYSWLDIFDLEEERI